MADPNQRTTLSVSDLAKQYRVSSAAIEASSAPFTRAAAAKHSSAN